MDQLIFSFYLHSLEIRTLIFESRNEIEYFN